MKNSVHSQDAKNCINRHSHTMLKEFGMSATSRRTLISGLGIWLVVLAIGLWILIPIKEKLRFGIDLVGGTYITLEVQTEKAIESELLAKLEGIPDRLKKAKAVSPISKKIEKKVILLTFETIDAANTAAQVLGEDEKITIATEGPLVKISFKENVEQYIARDAVERDIEVLHTRLNRLGVAEITIASQGEKNIIIELPGVDNPQEAKMMIGKSAMLEFRLVEKVGSSEEQLRMEYDGQLPEGMEVLPGKNDEDRTQRYYLVPIFSTVTGKQLRNASAQVDTQQSRWIVEFELTAEGGEKFYDLSSKNYLRQLAIVIDGEVISAPVLKGSISTKGQIEGDFSPQQAKQLALLLKSGAFVAPVTFEEERQVGATLGAESIKAGLTSCIVALVLLLIFSIIYYKLAGFFACLALLFNLFLVLVGMSRWVLGATLTLPGIAGMVLTVGMAIDASILIYEKIKEEIAAGTAIKQAVKIGFSDAMVVILDSNITTFITGIVLYKFGTGPIQGFAVTMMLGIVATLITGLFFLRSLFNVYLDNVKVQKLSI